MISRLPILILFIFYYHASASFNWGDGCQGGNGTFTVNLTQAGQLVNVGAIPAGKYNVKVFLSASADVDVQIFDAEDTTTFPQGKAVVAWCANAKTCNIGKLGSDEGAGTANYKSMRIGYSGYGGINGKPGKEYITIEGKATTTLHMKAFAFEAGLAVVDYSWDRVQTACCLGIAPCTGQFSTSVPKDGTVNIGNIPRSKKNLRVQLYSPKDVDIQLYDVEDTTKFSEGKAIIGYCDANDCNKGILGNNDGEVEATVYKNLTYTYSGYDGVKGNKGNEYLSVSGLTNTMLNMKAFGYASGEALVSYSYYEDWIEHGPIQPSIDWMMQVNHRDVKTDTYRNVPSSTMIVRRDNQFQFLISSPNNGVIASDVDVKINGWVGDAYHFGLSNPLQSIADTDHTTNAQYPTDSWTMTTVQDGATRVGVVIALQETAPVGSYRLTASIRVKEGDEIVTYERSIALIVLFNPFGKKDAVRQSQTNVVEYVQKENGLIWQGLSDSNTAHSWIFDQYDYANLIIALDSLRRMQLLDRSDVVLISRHLTYAVGEDICYGKWGDGSYTSGKPDGGYRCSKTKSTTTHNKCFEPGHWTGTTELFNLHRSIGGKKVQYCQCFVYSGVLTTIGRSLGIPARPVTTFQSAHDTGGDRSISKYFTVDSVTGVFLPTEAPEDVGHDSIWSFHVWTEFFMKRPTLNAVLNCKTCSDGWQAVDATPQEYSSGGDSSLTNEGYYMGPSSIKLIRNNQDPICRSQSNTFGCYDNQFVISEVNSNILMYTKSNDGDDTSFELYPKDCGTKEQCGFAQDPFGDVYNTVGLQISTKKKGTVSDACKRSMDSESPRDCTAELDDLTKKYKKSEPSSPGIPTIHERRRTASTLNVKAKLGIAPSSSGPVVNEPGHPASTVQIGIILTEDNNDNEKLNCALKITARDYAGNVLGQIYNATIINSRQCTFPDLKRSAWRQYASTHMDVKDGFIDMEAGSRAFALHFEVTATTTSDNILVLVDSRIKIICTPIIGAGSLKNKLFCDDQRGQWIRPSSESTTEKNALSHLTRQNCIDAGVTKSWGSRGGPNDGVCQQSNNINGCFDGGDCCSFSCWEKNGEFKRLSDPGNTWEFAHTCFDIDETTQCFDPVFANNVFQGRELDYTQPTPPDSFGIDASNNNDEDLCVLSAQNLTEYIVENGCDHVSNQICGDNALYATAECNAELKSSLMNSNCNLPRCAARTIHGCRCQKDWSYTNGDDTLFTFANHKCGNPYLGDADGGYHYNSWCEVVPGSCTKGTFDGVPGENANYYDDNEQSWWDDCGVSFNHLTGQTLVPEPWSLIDIAMVDDMGHAGFNTSGEMKRLVETSRVAVAPSPEEDLGNAPSSSFDGNNNNKDEDDHSNTGVTSDGMRRQQVVLSWVLGWFLVVVPHVLSLQ